MQHAAPIRASDETIIGELFIAPRPGRPDDVSIIEDRLKLTEGQTYVFRLAVGDDDAHLTVEPGLELFDFDDETRRRGRLRPREHVGRIRVAIREVESGRSGVVELDVAPTKLESETEYRQMLR